MIIRNKIQRIYKMTTFDKQNYPDEPLIISYLSLRKFVGMLGTALPFVSVAGTFVFSNCKTILPSISQYYYSVMGNFFVGSLCGVAIFLFTYKGYDAWDRILTNAAGIFAVAAAFFPTHISKLYISCLVNNRDCSDVSDTIHLIASALFFITLAVISIFLFTKSGGLVTKEKLMRNKIYKACGYTMLFAILLIGIFQLKIIYPHVREYKPTVSLETIALLAFGFSWLTKGQFLVKDK